MKIIFLDFHGVLFVPACYVTARLMGQAPSAHPGCIEALNYITDATGARIVATSSWRSNGMGFTGDLLFRWGARGTVVDVTPATVRGLHRREIEEWFKLCYRPSTYEADLIGRRGIESFVVLDSDPEMGWLCEFLVRTDPEMGLTMEQAHAAVHMLNRSDVPTDYVRRRVMDDTMVKLDIDTKVR